MYHLVWVPFPWQYGLWTRERLVFSLIWECGIILHVWGIYITLSYMRVSLATEVGVLVGDGSLGFGAKYCSSQSNIHPSQRGVGPT